MDRWWGIVVVGLAFGCNGGVPAEPHPEPVPVVAPAPEPVAEPAPAPEPTPGDPAPEPSIAPAPMSEAAAIYEACRERVEQPEGAGECKTSADCGSGGCSGEMCVARSLGAITSTCEVRACFALLDTCGCVDGKCQWSIKDSVPPRRTMPPLE